MLSGKELRDFRNSLDLSLRDVERETYISKKTLIGIESEENKGMKLRRYLELYYKDKQRVIMLAKWASDDEEEWGVEV